MLSKLFLATVLATFALGAHARPASQVSPSKPSSVNDDAMTIQKCRERMAMPKKARPKDDDPQIDLDRVCENLLNAGTNKPRSGHAASAAAGN